MIRRTLRTLASLAVAIGFLIALIGGGFAFASWAPGWLALAAALIIIGSVVGAAVGE